MCLTIAIGFLQGTQTVVAIITGKHTVLTTHNASDHIAILVSIGYALLVNNTLGRSREVGPYGVEAIFYGCYLVKSYWRTGIAFYTADALALLIVTAEALGDNIRGYQDTSNF
jgi:hypothetical protein